MKGANRCDRRSSGWTSAAPKVCRRWAVSGEQLSSWQARANGGLPAGRSRRQLDSHPPTGNMEEDPQVPVPFRLPDLFADGRFVDSVGCQVGYMPFDYKTQAGCGKSDWKWQVMPMDPACWSTWCRRDNRWARSAEAATATGIPAGLPLIAAAADKACEVLGAGCLEPHSAA